MNACGGVSVSADVAVLAVGACGCLILSCNALHFTLKPVPHN